MLLDLLCLSKYCCCELFIVVCVAGLMLDVVVIVGPVGVIVVGVCVALLVVGFAHWRRRLWRRLSSCLGCCVGVVFGADVYAVII